MSEQNTNYQKALSEVLEERRASLERSEIVGLQEKIRAFQTAYTSLYTLLLNKGFIKKDPYKGDAKPGEICIPPNTPFPENESAEQISIRLASYDTQLDFLASSYQFNVDFFTIERIKQVLGLIKYVDWVHLSANSQSVITAAVGGFANRLRGSTDTMEKNMVNGITVTLQKLTSAIIGDLKGLTDFNREMYKLTLRRLINEKNPGEKAPSITDIKKFFAAAKPKQAFYTEWAEAVLKEDYSPEGPVLREKILKALGGTGIEEQANPKAVKPEPSIKSSLVEGIQALGSVSSTLIAIGGKFDENELLMERRKMGFWGKVKRVMGQMLNQEQEPTIYEIQFPNENDSGKGVKQQVNFTTVREDISKKANKLTNAASKNAAKLETLPEDQLFRFLETAIKDIRAMHRVLSALDDYFKTAVAKEDRDKVKGIKPELAAIKNALVKADEKFNDYSSIKGEGKTA